MTAHINKVYAREWNHDVVLVQGAVIRLPQLDGDCEPPPHRATFNKIPLLQLALKQKQSYDQLLILDTDAMVYNMTFDITKLLPHGRMLAAQKARPTDVDHTWDINAGVTLWDLHHPLIDQAAKEWYQSSIHGMSKDFHPSNDQYHLHSMLQKGKYTKLVHGLSEEFNYGHGTIVKHFIRKVQHKGWGDPNILERREDRIEVAVNDVCAKHQALCDGIEKKVYVE
jgi:hypothetical protein